MDGKHLAEMAKLLVTKAASPIASSTRTIKLAQKKICPGGRKFRKLQMNYKLPIKERITHPNNMAVTPVIVRPITNMSFDPMYTI